MPSEPLILGFDTSAAHCAAALLKGTQILGTHAEDMSRGQAERLIPLLQHLLKEHQVSWGDLTAIGVGTGPGNFTGIRISVSAARGLALGLSIPAVGVDGFDARKMVLPEGSPIAIPAPRDQMYVPGPPPQLCPAQTPPPQIAATDLAIGVAQCAALRWQETTAPPAPVYVRPADAAPARDKPPVLLDP